MSEQTINIDKTIRDHLSITVRVIHQKRLERRVIVFIWIVKWTAWILGFKRVNVEMDINP